MSIWLPLPKMQDANVVLEVEDNGPGFTPPAEIGVKSAYVKAMFTPNGVIPAGGPETVLAVLSGFSKNMKCKTVDVSRTCTSEFVKKARQAAARDPQEESPSCPTHPARPRRPSK